MKDTRRPYKERVISQHLHDTLQASRVTALVGPRQSGKTTLATQIASDHNMRYLSLEYPIYEELAGKNLVDFLRQGADRWVIDEVQLLPFSQIETDNKASDPLAFLKQAFHGHFFPSAINTAPMPSSPDILQRLLESGYPAAFMISHPELRQQWLQNYVESRLNDEIRHVQDLKALDKLPNCLHALVNSKEL